MACSLLFYCSSSYSEEYQQQYEVGGMGPNGGTVTEVTITSVFVEEDAVQQGDFLEVTQTYQYTETVTESVDSVSFTTTTEVTPVTTSNLVSSSEYTDTNINVVSETNKTYGMQGAEFTTGNQSMDGGTRVYTREFTEQNKQSVDYGVTVYSHGSNRVVPACENTTSDCRDDWSLTVSLYNEDQLVDTISHSYTGIDWSGSRDYTWTQDVSSLDFNYGVLSLYGIDRGYNSGYYGPGFSDPYARLTYNVIEHIINRVVTQVEMQTVQNTDVYVYDSIYNPQTVVSNVSVEPITETTFEIVVEAESFGTEIVEVFELEVEYEAVELEVVDEAGYEMDAVDSELVEFEGAIEVDEAQNDMVDTEAEADSEVAAVEAEAEESEVVVEAEQAEVKTTYSPVLDTVRLALMVNSGSTVGLRSYQQQQIPDVEFYDVISYDGGNNVDNPAGRWMVGSSDVLMDEMVDLQWQR